MTVEKQWRDDSGMECNHPLPCLEVQQNPHIKTAEGDHKLSLCCKACGRLFTSIKTVHNAREIVRRRRALHKSVGEDAIKLAQVYQSACREAVYCKYLWSFIEKMRELFPGICGYKEE